MVGKTAVLRPNLGLYLDRPVMAVPARALIDGNNFRIKNGALSNLNIGWSQFSSFILLDAAGVATPVTLVDNFFLRSGAQVLVFGSDEDLYKYNEGPDDVSYITPIEVTGTVDVTNANPAVVTSASGPTVFSTNGVKAGDAIHFGSNTQTDPDAVWYVIDTVDSDTQLTLTAAVVGAPLTGSTYTARKLFTGTIQDGWDTEIFLDAQPDDVDLWFATNGVDDVVKWDTANNQVVSLSALGFTAKYLTVFRNMMLYSHVTESAGEVKPTSIKNSDVTKPEDMAGGLASEFIIHDGDDEIVELKPLGDNIVIYAERHVILGQFVGDPLGFVFREAISGIGPIGHRLISDFGDFHDFAGADAKYRFDGVQVQEVGRQVWRDILRRRDGARIDLGFAHVDEENGDVLWAMPLSTDVGAGASTTNPPEEAYSEHYLEEVGRSQWPVSRRSCPFTSSGYFARIGTLTWSDMSEQWDELNIRWNDQFFLASFPFNLFGAASGKVFTLNTSQNADGSALVSFVRFGRRPTVDGASRGLVQRVYAFATQFAGNTMKVIVRLFDHAGAPNPAITDTQTLDLDLVEDGHFTSHFRAGRYVEFEFGTDGPSEPWELSGFDHEIKRGGAR